MGSFALNGVSGIQRPGKQVLSVQCQVGIMMSDVSQ